MKTTVSLRLRLTGAAVILAAMPACTSLTPGAQTQKRIQEKPVAYTSLTPQQQGDVLGGAIERNNTTEMVYLALGKPDKIVTSADGKKAMWVYKEFYAAKAAFTTSFNNPNSAHYIPGATGVNSGPNHGGPAWANEPSSIVGDATKAVAPMQSLSLPELKEKTVYVFFFLGRVAEIKLDGDASDQRTVAANTPLPRAKAPTETGFTRSAYGADYEP